MHDPEARSPNELQLRVLSDPPLPPSIRDVMWAPWLGIKRPCQAAAIMYRSPTIAFWFSIELCYAVASIVIILIAWWDLTLTWDLLPAAQSNFRVQQRSWMDAWSRLTDTLELHTRVGYIFFVGNFLVQPILIAAQLPRIPLSIATRARVALAASAIASVVAFGLCVSLLALAATTLIRRWDFWVNGNNGWISGAFEGVAAVVAGAICISRGATAVEGLVESLPTSADPPRCENCGYDLTHLSATQRCTECGSELDESLNPSRSRPDPEWEHQRTMLAWALTSCRVLISPREFYRRLSVRKPGYARSFAGLHYCIAGLALMMYAASNELSSSTFVWRINLLQIVASAASNALVILLPIWLLHRLVGLVALAAANYSVRTGAARISRIADYEAVMIPSVIAAAFAAETLHNKLAYGAVAVHFPTFANYATLIFPVISALITVICIARVVVAVRAIRYANF